MSLRKVKYYRKNKKYLLEAECKVCGKLLGETYHNKGIIWIKVARNKRFYYCNECKERIFGGISLWEDYPDEDVALISNLL